MSPIKLVSLACLFIFQVQKNSFENRDNSSLRRRKRDPKSRARGLLTANPMLIRQEIPVCLPIRRPRHALQTLDIRTDNCCQACNAK